MSKILVIAEKPNAAEKIAYALGKTQAKREGKVRYYVTSSNGDTLIVAPLVGHLFSLGPKTKSKYPTFDLEWKPIWEVSKKSDYAKPYAKLIEKLAKEVDRFIIASDFDNEGELLGLNALRFLCKKEDAKRMKFSTLTASDLKESYENILPSLDWGQAEAGEARHYLDWIWGINLSQAAMQALLKATKFRKILSIGRVQGPALAFLAKRELEIRNFVTKPYWQISIKPQTKPEIEAFHIKGDFWNKDEAQKIFEKVKDKPAKVSSIKTTEENVQPPVPFDLTSLQMEAWRNFRMSPKFTQQIAQDLYTKALISYPRTSSQKLPLAINYKKIITSLGKQAAYRDLSGKLLGKPLKPREGLKSDPAHPAIYPTGEMPDNLEQRQGQVYDLITRRFLAVFAESALRETVKIIFDVNKESFSCAGSRYVEDGWRIFYKPYLDAKELVLPKLAVEDTLKQKSNFYSKKTVPPKRYTPATIIKELEKRNLGTKSTRAQVIDTLAQRGYISGTSIEVTKLGQELINAFSKYAPDILSEQLTRHFEDEMEQIRERKKKKEYVFHEAKKVLIDLLNKFNLHAIEIGKELSEAVTESRRAETVLMKCPKCGIGDFRVIISKATRKRFLACNKYPDCKTAWPLPQQGLLKFLDEKHSCGTPMIAIIKRGVKPWKLCPNPNCPEKQTTTAGGNPQTSVQVKPEGQA